MAEEEKREGTFTGAYYVGKEFLKKGTKKDKEGNDVEWTLYRLSFKKNLEDQFPWRASAFNNVVDQLEGGEYYNIGYNLSEPKYNEKAKKEIQYKSVFYVKKAVPGEEVKTTRSTKSSVPSKEAIDKFYDEYKELGVENDSREKCLLCWFMNEYEKEYDALHEVIKEHYKEKE